MFLFQMNIKGRLFDLSHPSVMGIINVTTDSFYTSCRTLSEEEILSTARRQVAEGATILDIGGYSTRPGAPEVSVEEETQRVCRAVECIRREMPDICLSIDTFRASVARAAIKAGADIINDVSGGGLDEQMFTTMAELQVPYILTHMRGTPATMQQLTDYDDLVADMVDFFQRRIDQLEQLGVKDIIIDPGFGFSKTLEQNYELLRRLPQLHILDKPILVGLSHKSMLYKLLGGTADEMLNATTAANMLALMGGAAILRVHESRPALEAIKIFEATYPQKEITTN